MNKYWVMKTFQDWWTAFRQDNVIGIDEEGVDNDYLSFSSEDIANLLNDNSNSFNDYKDRVFKEFCKWMQVGDYVIIGTGQTTTFNISGIARVIEDYRFDGNMEPRHIREVEILKVFQNPISMQRFIRTPRLELIDEEDFHEAIISLL